MPPPDQHRTERIGWLRAAVLGANDGIVSTASLVIGVASAHAPRHGIVVAGVAGLVAGALSMAAGEYVSVSSQADTEKADLDLERSHLAAKPDDEHRGGAGDRAKLRSCTWSARTWGTNVSALAERGPRPGSREGERRHEHRS